MARRQVDDELRIALIGKTGSGKSLTGNTILGEKDKFQSLLSFDSQTSKMQAEKKTRFGRNLLVVDTPGLFDTRNDVTNEKILNEIKKSFIHLSPGPHAVILVIRLGRYAKEDRETANIFVQCFGEEMLSHLFVIFTGGDGLKKPDDLRQMLETTTQEELQTLVRNCNGRYMAFNNISGDSKQVERLIKMIDDNLKRNRGMYYSNSVFRKIEAAIGDSYELHEQVRKDTQKESSFGDTFMKIITAPFWGDVFSALFSIIKKVF